MKFTIPDTGKELYFELKPVLEDNETIAEQIWRRNGKILSETDIKEGKTWIQLLDKELFEFHDYVILNNKLYTIEEK